LSVVHLYVKSLDSLESIVEALFELCDLKEFSLLLLPLHINARVLIVLLFNVFGFKVLLECDGALVDIFIIIVVGPFCSLIFSWSGCTPKGREQEEVPRFPKSKG